MIDEELVAIIESVQDGGLIPSNNEKSIAPEPIKGVVPNRGRPMQLISYFVGRGDILPVMPSLRLVFLN